MSQQVCRASHHRVTRRQLFFDRYQTTTHACLRVQPTNIQNMQNGTIGNSLKHFENTANGVGSQERRLLHFRAALLICRNATGGNRSKRVVDGTITRFLSPDVRPHHLRFVMVQVMSTLESY